MLRAMKSWRQQQGSVAIEFAIIALPFFMLLWAIIEYGLILFTQVAVESATLQVAREASIGHGQTDALGVCSREEYVRQIIRQKTAGLINAESVKVSAAPVASGGVPRTQTPDICVSNNPPTVGGLCPGGIYEDVNHNGVYDATVPGLALASAGQLVELRVYYPWKVQIPFFGQFFGDHGILMITSSTVLKNEPFAGAGCS